MATSALPTSAAKMEVPLETYRVLDQRIRDIRARVLELAASRSSAISTESVMTALDEVLSSDSPGRPSSTHRFPKVPQNVLVQLERRLDALRPLVIDLATSLADEHESGKPASVTPAIMERAWEMAWENVSLRRKVLSRA